MSTKLGALVASLSLDSAQYSVGLDKAGARLRQFEREQSAQLQAIGASIGVGIGLAATAIGVGLAASIRTAINDLDQLNIAASRTGESLADLQKFNYIAFLSDASPEEVAKGIRTLGKEIGAAAAGNEKAVQTFKDLGIAFKDSQGQALKSTEVIKSLADLFQLLPDGPERSALALRLFGKAGEALIPLLADGRAGMEKLGKEFDAFGLEKTPEAIKQAALFNDNLDRLGQLSKSAARDMAGPLVGALNEVISKYLEAKKAGLGFADSIGLVLGGQKAANRSSEELKRLDAAIEEISKRNQSIGNNARLLAETKAQRDKEFEFFAKATQVNQAGGVGRGNGQIELDARIGTAQKDATKAEALRRARLVTSKEDNGPQRVKLETEKTDPFSTLSRTLQKERESFLEVNPEAVKYAQTLLDIGAARVVAEKNGDKEAAQKAASAVLFAQETKSIAEKIRLEKDASAIRVQVGEQEREQLRNAVERVNSQRDENKSLRETTDLFNTSFDVQQAYLESKRALTIASKEAAITFAAEQAVEAGANSTASVKLSALRDELALIREKYSIESELIKKQRDLSFDVTTGLKAGIRDYYDYVNREGDRARESFQGVTRSFEDSLTKVFEGGKVKASDFFNVIRLELSRTLARNATKSIIGGFEKYLPQIIGAFGGAVTGAQNTNVGDYNPASGFDYTPTIADPVASNAVTISNSFSFSGNTGDLAQQKAFSNQVAAQVENSILQSKQRGGVFA